MYIVLKVVFESVN